MYVKSILANNFRNISMQEIKFCKGINVLYGKNASGKTNALEAIYLFASGKSLRGSPEKDFIKKGEKMSKLTIDFESESAAGLTRSMSMTFLPGNKKIMKYGVSDVPRMSELLGHFRACVFTPDDLQMVRGAPEERRRFTDISISQIRPRFVHCLNSYFRILSQKNTILKNANITGKIDHDYLDVLNEQLASAASVIVKQRSGFCEKLSEYARDIYGSISDDRESFGMRYVSHTKHSFDDEEFTKDAYIKLFKKNAEREIKYGMSLVGPQKDDIYFCIGKNCEISLNKEIEENEDIIFDEGFNARAFGSRGQQRSVVLSLKLAQGELFREMCGEYPVFLLDDVFSELDLARRSYILSNTENKQIIITCCDCDILGNFSDYHGIYVEDGKYGN